MASEDIGLADPRALALCLDAVAAYERLGSPEGELALAEAVLYLAVAPKSNAVYRAYGRAAAEVARGGSLEVPVHLRNAPTRLARALGHGAGYRYDHDLPDAVAYDQRGFPAALGEPVYYEPSDRGLEERIKARLEAIRARRGQR
jgi:putative ATPase